MSPFPSTRSARRRWPRVLLVAGLLAASSRPARAAAAADPDCGAGAGSRSRYRALVCWLWRAELSLPDESFRESVLTLHVKDMTCTNFQVAALDSAPASAYGAEAAEPSIHISARGISARCTGRYDASFMSGAVVAAVAGARDGGPSLRLRAGVVAAPLGGEGETVDARSKAALPFPARATLSSCAPDFLVSDVTFSGSASAHIIGLFSGVIAKKVTAAMNEHVCALIKKNGEALLDGYLGSARRYIAELILDPSSAEDTVDGETGDTAASVALARPALHKRAKQTTGSDTVGWDQNMPFLKRVLVGLNEVVSQHLDAGFILAGLQRLGTWQSLTAAECEDCGFFFKGVNGLVGSLTKGTGAAELPVPATFLAFHHNHTFAIPKYGDITLTALRVKVAGLDALTDLSLFRPEGENRLTSSLASRAGLAVSVLLNLQVIPVDDAVFRSDTLNETFELHFNTSDLSLSSSSAWALDREIYDRLTVGSFLYGSYSVFDNHRDVLNCVVEALESVVIQGLTGRMTLDAMRLSPVPARAAEDAAGLEDNVDALINAVLQLLLSQYPATTTEALAALLRTPARKVLNDGLAHLIDETKKKPLHCVNAEMPKDTSERPLRFDENKALKVFNDVVNNNNNVAVANAFIGCVDKITTANKLLAGHLYNFGVGELTVVLHDLQLVNAASVSELALLRPEVDHYRLASEVGYGTCAAATEAAAGCTTTQLSFGLNLVHATRGNLGNVNVHVKGNNWKLGGEAEIKLDLNYLPYLQIADLLARPQCLSVPLTRLALHGLNATVDLLEVTIDADLTGGPHPRAFAYRTGDATALARDVSALLSQGALFLQGEFGAQVATQFGAARDACATPVNPHRSDARTRSTRRAGVWTFLIVVAFVVGNSWLFLRGFKGERREVPEQEVVFSSDEHAEGPTGERQESSLNEPLLSDEDELDANLEVEMPRRKFPLSSTSSLMYHPSIHPAIKYAFPSALALAFLLFFSANISVGASVDLLVTRANGQPLTSPINVYAFSLASTIGGMFRAGVYLLMLLVLSCSGLWPYAKLVLLLACWIASTRRLPPIKRERILYLLDSLGKFSLVDVYVLVLMMVAFRYRLEVDGVGGANVYVTPEYGFYAFLFATILSLVAGHVALFLHRRTMLPSIPVYSGRHESLSRHVFDDKRGRGLVKLTKRFRRTVLFALFLASVLICVGVGLKSFHFEFNGVAGTALGDARVRSFSLVSLGEQIPQSVQESSSFGVYWIQTCYFFFALIMPLVCLLSMFVLFLVPLRLKQQQMAFMLVEVANAWSAIEVFVLAIVISLIEIAPFAESMIGSRCALIDNILSGWSGGDGGDTMQSCFGVKSSLNGSSAVLIIGVILNSLLVSMLHRFAHHSLAERIEREDRPDATDSENKIVQDCVFAHTFVSSLRSRPRLGAFVFEEVSFGPHGEYSIDFENVAEQEEEAQGHTSNNFWSEWRKIVSVV